MTKKKAKKYEQPALPILKLDNVPGPEASDDELVKHYERVRGIFACRNYDDVLAACHWCCDMEEGLAYTKPDEARGNRMFCSGRCASAHAAYRALAHGPPKPNAEQPTSGPSPSTSRRKAKEAAEEPDPEPEEDDGADDNPPAENEEASADEPTEAAAPPESPSDWKPKGQRARKPRKAKVKKPERADGKCAKGLHKMKGENRYEYKGTVWCRACRAESRARSAAKKKNDKSK